ncbi:putative protein kinase RLK-Pelle-LRR-XII-1 family [Helianthus anomalus]
MTQLVHSWIGTLIPPSIGHLKELQVLDLSQNQISGIIPREIGNLLKLQTLQLFENSLSGSIPTEIVHCKNLTILNLYSNKLTGIVHCFGNLRALVLEYMENGNLDKLIHDSRIDRSRWDLSERVDVLVSVSRGLVYLHSEYDFPIVQCDLKPSNILLNEKWNVHVSDFGTARIMGVHHQD